LHSRESEIVLKASMLLITAALIVACSQLPTSSLPLTESVTTTETPASPTPTTPGPEQLVAQYVREQIGGVWAGDCDRTNVLSDTGKYCAKFFSERNGVRAYRIAQTFAEPTHWAFVDQIDGVWRLAAVDPIVADDAAPGVPWPLKIGDTVIVTGTGSCLNVRAAPRPDAPVRNCLKDGTEVTVVEGPRFVEGRRWWLLAGEGWGADSYLRYPDAIPGRP
jgi:hypothetical protein